MVPLRLKNQPLLVRQAGIIAAAAKLALSEQVDRLAEDHHHATLLAEALYQFDEFEVDVNAVQTNMVFARLASNIDPNRLSQALLHKGIKVSPSQQLRLVTHADITSQDIATLIASLKQVLSISLR